MLRNMQFVFIAAALFSPTVALHSTRRLTASYLQERAAGIVEERPPIAESVAAEEAAPDTEALTEAESLDEAAQLTAYGDSNVIETRMDELDSAEQEAQSDDGAASQDGDIPTDAIAEAAVEADENPEAAMRTNLEAETSERDEEAEMEALDMASSTVLLQASVEMHRKAGKRMDFDEREL
mmetsp:Transcript_40095/g.72677  ORF Transcript_40095/g.72677 Transcript_40095/m.72677 type:complete len:181 (+) Transcript_40095:101-643(+)